MVRGIVITAGLLILLILVVMLSVVMYADDYDRLQEQLRREQLQALRERKREEEEAAEALRNDGKRYSGLLEDDEYD